MYKAKLHLQISWKDGSWDYRSRTSICTRVPTFFKSQVPGVERIREPIEKEILRAQQCAERSGSAMKDRVGIWRIKESHGRQTKGLSWRWKFYLKAIAIGTVIDERALAKIVYGESSCVKTWEMMPKGLWKDWQNGFCYLGTGFGNSMTIGTTFPRWYCKTWPLTWASAITSKQHTVPGPKELPNKCEKTCFGMQKFFARNGRNCVQKARQSVKLFRRPSNSPAR